MRNSISKIIITFLFSLWLLAGCSANLKEANSIKSRVNEIVKEHPVTDSIARIHYVAGKIAIIGEEDQVDLEIEPVSKINKITVAIFATSGLKMRKKIVRHYSKIDNTKVMRDSIRFTPKEEGEHTISVFILLQTAAHGTVARELTIPIRSGK